MKNPGLRLLSLFFAVLLYIFVHSQSNNSVVALVVPLELQNLPTGKMILYPAIRQANVTIQGPSFIVSEVASSPLAFRVKLPSEVGNRYDVSLREEQLTLPPGVTVVNIEPSELQLTLTDKDSKVVPIKVETIGEINSNLRIVELRAEPDKIKIEGAQNEVADTKAVSTYPIDLRDLNGDVTQTVSLRSPGAFTKLPVETVQVYIHTTSLSEAKRFGGLMVEVRSRTSQTGLNLIPKEVTVEVSGPKAVVKTLKPELVIPYVRVEGDIKEAMELPVSLDVPKDVVVVGIEPERVKISPIVTEVVISKGDGRDERTGKAKPK